MTRLIDADKLHALFDEQCAGECDICTFYEKSKGHLYCGLIDFAPTVDERLLGERVDGEPKSKCKNCKAYRQYGSRADGYCDISRMTAEGMLHINVNEDFYCSYFEEADNESI